MKKTNVWGYYLTFVTFTLETRYNRPAKTAVDNNRTAPPPTLLVSCCWPRRSTCCRDGREQGMGEGKKGGGKMRERNKGEEKIGNGNER